MNFDVKKEFSLPISGFKLYYPGPSDSFLELRSQGHPLKVIFQLKREEVLMLYLEGPGI